MKMTRMSRQFCAQFSKNKKTNVRFPLSETTTKQSQRKKKTERIGSECNAFCTCEKYDIFSCRSTADWILILWILILILCCARVWHWNQKMLDVCAHTTVTAQTSKQTWSLLIWRSELSDKNTRRNIQLSSMEHERKLSRKWMKHDDKVEAFFRFRFISLRWFFWCCERTKDATTRK